MKTNKLVRTSAIALTSNKKINIDNYFFYIEQQQIVDVNGKPSEISAVLTLEIPEEHTNGMAIREIIIIFLAVGAPSVYYDYSESDKRLTIEYLHRDLNTWLVGLQLPASYLNITFPSTKYVTLSLLAGKK